MTPHIEAEKKDISKLVLMPGDPVRASYIAKNFLTDLFPSLSQDRCILNLMC